MLLITPTIVDYATSNPEQTARQRTQIINEIIDTELIGTEQKMEELFDGDDSLTPTDYNERK